MYLLYSNHNVEQEKSSFLKLFTAQQIWWSPTPVGEYLMKLGFQVTYHPQFNFHVLSGNRY